MQGPPTEAGWAGLTWTDRDMGRTRESFLGQPFFFFSTVSISRSSFHLDSEEGLARRTFSSLLLSRRSRGLSSFTRFCSFNLKTNIYNSVYKAIHSITVCLFYILLILLYVYGYFACMCIYVPHVCLIPSRGQNRARDPWNWNY